MIGMKRREFITLLGGGVAGGGACAAAHAPNSYRHSPCLFAARSVA